MSDTVAEPRVSVVVPTFNNDETLTRAVASSLSQVQPVHEVLVVDDCSERTAILDEVAALDPKVKVIRHARNLGGADARNTGIRAAEGEYIAFLDADDAWLPHKLRTQLTALSGASTMTYAASNCFTSFESDAAVHNARGPLPGEALSHYLLASDGALQTSTLLVPTPLARQVGFTPGLKRHQDWDFLLRLEHAGAQLQYQEEPLSIYDLSPRPGRISRADRAVENTVAWFRLMDAHIPTRLMQRYFVDQCLSRRSARFPARLLLAASWVARRDPAHFAQLCWLRARRLARA
ncbi:MAG: glycosyltransferase family 2 protein [Myxococcales bacterium]|nr:glycosyltransferase family 2 protein [Myxococcales bacterium]